MKNKLYIFFVFLTAAFVLLCGCNRDNNDDNFDSYWYSCSSYIIPATEGYEQSVIDYIYHDGNYYLTVYGIPEINNETGVDYYKLFKVDPESDTVSSIDLPMESFDIGPGIISDNNLICGNGQGVVYEINVNNGKIVNMRQTDLSIIGVYDFESGYVIVTADNMALYYTFDGNETGRVDIGDIYGYVGSNSFFEKDGRFYLTSMDSDNIVFYELDFSDGSYSIVTESCFLINYAAGINKDLVFNDFGIYTYDFDNDSLIPVTEWSYVDVKPGSKKNMSYLISYGNGRFGKMYEYFDNEIELIVFNKEPSENYENRIPIKIGGYGVNSSEAIKWAVYKFNTSQTEYHVYTEDYYESFDYQSGEEAQANTAELLQYFNSGNAPDIYYGFNFDYRYFYNAGMVINMIPLMEEGDVTLEDFVSSIKDTVAQEDVCYQLFPGYTFKGDWGRRAVFGDDEYTYDMIADMASEAGISVRGDCESVQIVDQIIRYSMDELVRQSDGEHVLSLDTLTEIVNYAVTTGVPEGYVNNIANLDSVHEGLYLKCMSFLGNLYSIYDIENKLQDSFVYLGRPSVYGSAYIAEPDGLVAISSDTEYSDVCWQVIKEMFCDEVQYLEIANGNNPVMERVFEEYCSYAQAPDTVPEDNYFMKSIVYGREAVPEWIVDDYRAMTGTIDTVITYDWGLYNMIRDEINSYDLQGKTPEEIAESLQSRLDLYAAENYG